MTTLTAIETHYAGCRFRSRLEARWAVFFDHLGIEWQYEPQGFELPSGERYLPDFHLPQHDLWVEVKGDEAAFLQDGSRYAEAALLLEGAGLMILGPVPDVRDGLPQHFVLTAEKHCCGERVLCMHIAWADMLRHPTAVREVGLPCTELISHRQGELPPLRGYNGGRAKYTDPGPVPGWHEIGPGGAAYKAARSARFEHGESGTQPDTPHRSEPTPEYWAAKAALTGAASNEGETP